jgi:hypothetical protein
VLVGACPCTHAQPNVAGAFQTAGDETARVWQAGYFNDQDCEFHRTFDRNVDEVLGVLRRGEEPPVHARPPGARTGRYGRRIVRDRKARIHGLIRESL